MDDLTFEDLFSKKEQKKRVSKKREAKKQEKKRRATKREMEVKKLFHRVEERHGKKLVVVLKENDLDDVELIAELKEGEIGEICGTIGLKRKMGKLQKWILENPTQWFWQHNRFN